MPVRSKDPAARLAEEFARLRVTSPMVPRGQREILRCFDGFSLVEPGLDFPSLWRPADPASADGGARRMYAGVGRR